MRLSTRLGTYEGYLIRLPIVLVADEGESLKMEGNFFVSDDWPSPVTFPRLLRPPRQDPLRSRSPGQRLLLRGVV